MNKGFIVYPSMPFVNCFYICLHILFRVFFLDGRLCAFLVHDFSLPFYCVSSVFSQRS